MLTEQRTNIDLKSVANEKFGKKTINRLSSVCDEAGSSVKLSEGVYGGQQLRARHFLPALADVNYEKSEDPLAQAKFNRELPLIAAELLQASSTAKKEGYIDAIGGNDFENFPQIIVDLAAKGGKDSGMVFRMVYGATEIMPARALSYPLPALIMMDELQKQGIELPQLQIVFANHISSALNNFDPQESSKQAKILSGVTQGYIDTIFPNLAGSVIFLEDTQQIEEQIICGPLQTITQTLLEQGDDAVINALQKKGFDSTKDNSTAYGAAHLLFHDISLPDLLQPLLHDQQEYRNPNAIINIGGRQEQFFYGLRHSLRDTLGSEYKFLPTVQLFTKHHVPPYYMAKGGDIPLEALLQGKDITEFDVATTARHDLAYLQKITQARGGEVFV